MTYFQSPRKHLKLGKYMVEVTRLRRNPWVPSVTGGAYAPVYGGHRPLFDWHNRRPHPDMEPLPERRLHLFGYVWVFMLYMWDPTLRIDQMKTGGWVFYRKEGP